MPVSGRTPIWIVFALAAGVGCSGSSSSPSPGATASTTSISSVIVAAPLGLFAGDSAVASALATTFLTSSTTGNTQVRDQASWQSSTTSVATVAPGGAVTAIGPGTTQLTATYQGVSGSDTLRVFSDSDLTTITILSCPSQLLVGQNSGCNAVMNIQGLNVASKAVWSSTNPAVVAVAAGGHITAASVGQSSISATYRGVSGSLQMSVTAAQQDALRIDDVGLGGQFKVGNTVSMSVGGLYSVVSAATGQLSLRISDQNAAVVATTSPMTVLRGSDSFHLSASFTIPAGATRLCSKVILQVGSVTVSQASGLNLDLFCAAVTP